MDRLQRRRGPISIWIAAGETERRWLDRGQRQHPLRSQHRREKHDHGAVRVPDQMRIAKLVEQSCDVTHIGRPAIGLLGLAPAKATTVDENDPVLIGERPLFGERLSPHPNEPWTKTAAGPRTPNVSAWRSVTAGAYQRTAFQQRNGEPLRPRGTGLSPGAGRVLRRVEVSARRGILTSRRCAAASQLRLERQSCACQRVAPSVPLRSSRR